MEGLGVAEPEKIRTQLARLLSSPDFARAPRHSRFLAYIVEETLAGRGGDLKEYVIATTVFDKPTSFNPRDDSTVRTEATKLRLRLDRYYANPQAGGELKIELPKGAYVPAFAPPPPEASPPAVVETVTRSATARWPLVATGCALAALAGVLFLRRQPSTAERLVSISVINSLPGQKRTLSFSPDGTRVAFSWTGPREGGKGDIWVQSLESGSSPMKLTSSPNQDWSPSWSPDGRTIAFVRDPYEKAEVYTISADGGQERKEDGVHAFRLSWAPDGKSFVTLGDAPGRAGATAVFVVNITSHASRQVTFPSLSEISGHTNFAVSPAGNRVAYISDTGDTRRIMVSPTDESGPSVEVSSGSNSLSGIAWSTDGKSLFVTDGEPENRLHRLFLNGEPTRTVIPGLESTTVGHFTSMRGSPTRIAANRINANFEIWTQTPGEPASDRLLLNEEGNAWAPQFSPDGSTIAFLSDRSGSTQIWIARDDGGGSSQVSSLPCTPLSVRWEPTGRRQLVFDCAGPGGGIYTVGVDSGKPQRMDAPTYALSPSYSANGKLIYFTSHQSGRTEVWSMPTASGPATLVTHNGAAQGLETPDGKSLIFLKDVKDSTLWKLSLADGRETPFRDCWGWRGWWEVDGAGVVITDPDGTLWRQEDEKRATLGRIGGFIPNRGGFSIHPKRRQIVYGRATKHSDDLILVRFDR